MMENFDKACTIDMGDDMGDNLIFGIRVFKDSEGKFVACVTDKYGHTECSILEDVGDDLEDEL